MRLAEWSAQSGIPVGKENHVCISPNNPFYPQLYRLDDFAVSSNICGVVWLMPRSTTKGE